jgi:hypothetical protein
MKWKILTDSNGITLRILVVEAHSSLGIGERYHGSFRRVYLKIKHEFPHVNFLSSGVSSGSCLTPLNPTIDHTCFEASPSFAWAR